MRRAIVVVIDARGAVVMHGAETDGHRGECTQRHERDEKKQQRGFEPAAHASDASTRVSTLSTCPRPATRFQSIEDRAVGPLVAMAVSREMIQGGEHRFKLHDARA